MERDIGTLKEYLVMLLSDLIKEREAAKRLPYAVDMASLQAALIADAKDALNSLCGEKVLTHHRTLNDVSFEFTPPK